MSIVAIEVNGVVFRSKGLFVFNDLFTYLFTYLFIFVFLFLPPFSPGLHGGTKENCFLQICGTVS